MRFTCRAREVGCRIANREISRADQVLALDCSYQISGSQQNRSCGCGGLGAGSCRQLVDANARLHARDERNLIGLQQPTGPQRRIMRRIRFYHALAGAVHGTLHVEHGLNGPILACIDLQGL
jgi:hypothetical protein